MKCSSIDTIFLDLDGTLLDLAYDNYFWHDHIPNLIAKKNKLPFEKVKIEFENIYKSKQNTIEWYSLDYWSKIFEIDLKNEVLKTKNKIKIFPNAHNLLTNLKKRKIRIILLTNCPRDMLDIKLTQTQLWGFFDKIISSEDYGFSKEDDRFWHNLNTAIDFNKMNTLFVDDSENVLNCASRNGIKNIFYIKFPDSNKEGQIIKNFNPLDSIDLIVNIIID